MTTEKQPVSDDFLVGQAQVGCLASFEELVYRYETRIFRFVANHCRNETDAREVTQETFVTAFRKLRQFHPGKSFAAWLFTIARRKCIDRHRARRFEVEEPARELSDANDPSVLLARREAEENLWRLARRTLPELHFQALWLKYAEDLSVADIARVLRRTETHVKVLLFRARMKLGNQLKSLRTNELALESRFFANGKDALSAVTRTPVSAGT